MKKTIFALISIAVLISGNSFSQDQETNKKLFIGGYCSYSSHINKDYSFNVPGNQKTGSFQVSPYVGKFISNSFIIGGGLYYSNNRTSFKAKSNTDNIFDNNRIGNYYSLNVFVRYIKPINDHFNFYMHADIISYYSNYNIEYPNDPSYTYSKKEYLSYGIDIKPGILFYLNDKWALETSLGLLKYESNIDNSDDEKSNTKNFNIGLDLTNIFIGVDFFIK